MNPIFQNPQLPFGRQFCLMNSLTGCILAKSESNRGEHRFASVALEESDSNLIPKSAYLKN